MNTDLEVNKPAPIPIDQKYTLFDRKAEVEFTIKALKRGEYILIQEFYNDGILLLKELNKHLKLKLKNNSFKDKKKYRSEYQRLSNLVLLEVVDQNLTAKKAPSIGWLEKFYPENSHFLLTLPQIQGLNSSWQWYENGISLPVLRNKIHPYYGIYFPTRFEHLVLFENWLKRYEGPKKTAIEIGIGCGVLTFQMIQHGFQKVFATDINPNAIVGMKEFMGTTKLSRKVELALGHLFGHWDSPTELIVFNPPWLPKSHESSGIDDAMYYSRTLFTEFFAEAKKRLAPEGKLVLIFSNLAEITKVTTEHPIEIELAKGNRFELERCFKKSVKPASTKTKREAPGRALEEVELWVLKHK
jgi:hypothetical protein